MEGRRAVTAVRQRLAAPEEPPEPTGWRRKQRFWQRRGVEIASEIDHEQPIVVGAEEPQHERVRRDDRAVDTRPICRDDRVIPAKPKKVAVQRIRLGVSLPL
jgi:hypothetical protein